MTPPASTDPAAAAWIVYDLEYTTWEGARDRDWSGPGEHREIVQIGALKVDGDFRERACLNLLVRPRINPGLSPYFTGLTGITQHQVDSQGMDIADALAQLDRFAAGCPLLSNGADAAVIAENCRLAGCSAPFLPRCRDIRGLLVAATGKADLMSADLPDLMGLAPAGRGHDALADARAVAAALGFFALKA